MSAKEIIVKPIPKSKADAIVKKHHYSGKVVQNSQLCFGVWYKGILMGAMQFGPPTDKRRMLPLVNGSQWNGIMELNRMAFSEHLPKFSESRAISQAFKWIKKNAPHIKWVISFADGTQCGHGTIYQAANFKLTQIKENTGMIELPNGLRVHKIMFSVGKLGSPYANEMKKLGITGTKEYLDKHHTGWYALKGYMYRYIYFLDKQAEKDFTGEFIPFSKIKELNIEMKRGEWVNGASS